MVSFARWMSNGRKTACLSGQSEPGAPMTPVWFALWVCALACAWVLPNHYPPWAAFHADAWTALVLALAAAAVIWRVRTPVAWHGSVLLVAVLAVLPGLQYGVGLIPFAGQAWMSTAYLLGLLLTLLTGQQWERARPEQFMDGLFWAIGIAAIVSVYLQFQTWLGLNSADLHAIWSMGLVAGRPYANMGQPNQLATLLLWGLLACAWAVNKQKIGAAGAAVMAVWLLLGISLTQSRTAWLGLTFVLGASWVWRRHWHSKWLPWAATGLYAFFWSTPFLLKGLTAVLLLGSESAYLRTNFHEEPRPLAWKLFIQAALERPWFGYGWSEVGHAQLAMAADFPALHMTFGHSHNLFLDLVLWTGWPIGILVSVGLIWWFVRCVWAVTNAKDALMIMFLGVVGIHAMLELPLHYAYFLLPVGMVAGVLNQRVGGRMLCQTPRWTFIVLWLVAVSLLLGIARDYFRVESSVQTLRFELARIGSLPTGQPPDVVLLTQLRERIRFVRHEVRSGMNHEELDWLRTMASVYPGGGALYKVATALALNGQSEEAQRWLAKICKIAEVEECERLRRAWAHDALGNQLVAAVPWPQ